MKVAKLTERGDSLIPVPCWWDGTTKRYNHTQKKIQCNYYSFNTSLFIIHYSLFVIYLIIYFNSLLETIRMHRPELVDSCEDSTALPIPTSPPSDFFHGIHLPSFPPPLISHSFLSLPLSLSSPLIPLLPLESQESTDNSYVYIRTCDTSSGRADAGLVH